MENIPLLDSGHSHDRVSLGCVSYHTYICTILKLDGSENKAADTRKRIFFFLFAWHDMWLVCDDTLTVSYCCENHQRQQRERKREEERAEKKIPPGLSARELFIHIKKKALPWAGGHANFSVRSSDLSTINTVTKPASRSLLLSLLVWRWTAYFSFFLLFLSSGCTFLLSLFAVS